MKQHSEAMYWKTNKEWYRANYDKDCYELTELAPSRAIESFRMYQKENRIDAKRNRIRGFLRKLFR